MKSLNYFTLIAICIGVLTIAGCNSNDTKPTPPENAVGVILMHGKWGQPDAPHIQHLDKELRANGFIVMTPDMPWGHKRMYDLDYPSALSEIEALADKLRKQGAKKIIIAGHSLGANAAIAYTASGKVADGIIAIAPGHSPNLGAARFAESVEAAQRMIYEGNGEVKASFLDVNQGKTRNIEMTAIAYFSYFDPNGLGSIPLSAAMANQPIPFLWVIGEQDRLLKHGPDYAYNLFPTHPNNIYLVVSGGHRDTPIVASKQIIEWLNSLD
jgi:pimeloyl-ACP methyl ester carboxylesterase